MLSISGVQNHLILPAFFAGNAVFMLTFHRGGKFVDLFGIGKMVGDRLMMDHLIVVDEIDRDRKVHRHALVANERAVVPVNFDGGVILGAIGDRNIGHGSAREFKGHCRCGFDVTGALVFYADGTYANNFVLQNEPKRIDAMDTNVGDRAASGDRTIMQPCPRMIGRSEEREFSARKSRTPNVSGGDSVTQTSCRLAEAEYMRHPEQHVCFAGSHHHLSCFIGIHCQRFFAEDRLPAANRRQNIRQMAIVGAGDKNGIHIGASAKIFHRRKRVRKLVVCWRFSRRVLDRVGKRPWPGYSRTIRSQASIVLRRAVQIQQSRN